MTFLARAARSPQRFFLFAGLAVVLAVCRNGTRWGTFSFAGLLLILLAATLAARGIAHSTRAHDDDAPQPASSLLWLVLLLLVAGYLVLAVRLVRMLPGNFIDVYVFHGDAVRELLRGVNPYTTSHAYIYSARDHFYGPDVVTHGRVHVGFPYPPLTLYYLLPGYLLGDVRYASVAAVLLSAILIFVLRPHWQTLGVAAVLLLNPLTYFVIAQSWTETLVLLTLCLVVYVAVRHPRWLPLALGLFFASKQYTPLVLPLAGLLLPEFRWKDYLRVVGQAVAVAFALTVPFVLWNPRAFWNDVVMFQVHQPFRKDSLSFAVVWPIPLVVVLLAVAITILWSVHKSRRHPAMFAACYGFALLLFVCLNKQAFANYYFLISASFFLAAGALPFPFGESDSLSAALASRRVESSTGSGERRAPAVLLDKGRDSGRQTEPK